MIKNTFLFFILFRFIIMFLLKNYDYPDQYWQGSQIAHKIFYKYGYQTWQWTIQQPIRNPLYPYILSISYLLISLLPYTFQDYLIQLGPSLIQMFISIISDIFLFKIFKYLYGQLSYVSIFLIYSNWFYTGMLCRMYGNSFQTFLILISFYFWLIRKQQKLYDYISRFIVICAYVSRPTSIIIWVFIWPYQLFTEKGKIFSIQFFKFIFKNIINMYIFKILRFLLIFSSFCIGSLYYGKFILTQFNFIKYNFIQKWSQLYGINSILFYFYCSLPLILGPGIVLLFISIIMLWKQKKQQKQIIKIKQLKLLSILCFIYLVFSSLSAHKEHRFILPILPLLLIISIYVVRYSYKIIKLIIIIIFLFNIFLFLSVNSFGKQGSFQVMRQLKSNIPVQKAQDYKIIVMGQSHFIPVFSILHRNITLTIPNSSPMKMIVNQSQIDLLYKNSTLLYNILTQNIKQPDYVIGEGKYKKFYQQNILILFTKQKQWRNCNIFDEYFFGYDSVILYKNKKQKQKQKQKQNQNIQ